MEFSGGWSFRISCVIGGNIQFKSNLCHNIEIIPKLGNLKPKAHDIQI